MSNLIQDMLQQGIISPSKSPFSCCHEERANSLPRVSLNQSYALRLVTQLPTSTSKLLDPNSSFSSDDDLVNSNPTSSGFEDKAQLQQGGSDTNPTFSKFRSCLVLSQVSSMLRMSWDSKDRTTLSLNMGNVAADVVEVVEYGTCFLRLEEQTVGTQTTNDIFY
ncbi:hypothetical protein RJT34_11483 [Clitoria ternatea]|uniref:Uncharacterized protein n=1 Tax=Clitoria ternatea TaxID=43366 RepID=A0AAN9PIH4_CLITE